MFMSLHSPVIRAISTLAFSLTLAAPAAADHWRSQPGPCYETCPYARTQPVPMPASGKILGIMVSDLPNALLDAASVGYGVSVERVQPDSPAAAAGLRAGDIITEFAGKPVLSGDRLRWLVNKAAAGKNLAIKLMREGTPLTLTLSLPEARPREKCDLREPPKQGT